MNSPTLKIFTTRESFSYLWLKYVNGTNLNQHCAKSLIGEYSRIFERKPIVLQDIPLDEYNAQYFYICGVTRPYRWRDNLHLPFRYKQGSQIFFDFLSTHIEIEDAEQIPIYRQPFYAHPKGGVAAFNTCRNWQFAYMIENNLIPTIPTT